MKKTSKTSAKALSDSQTLQSKKSLDKLIEEKMESILKKKKASKATKITWVR